MEGSQSNTGFKVGLAILAVLFVVTAFYTSQLYSEKKENEALLISEKQQVMNDLNNMAKDYDEAIAESEIKNLEIIELAKRG